MSQATAFIMELEQNENKLVSVYHVLNKYDPKKELLLLYYVNLEVN